MCVCVYYHRPAPLDLSDLIDFICCSPLGNIETLRASPRYSSIGLDVMWSIGMALRTSLRLHLKTFVVAHSDELLRNTEDLYAGFIVVRI